MLVAVANRMDGSSGSPIGVADFVAIDMLEEVAVVTVVVVAIEEEAGLFK